MTSIPFDFHTSGITFTECDWQFRWMNGNGLTSLQQSQPFDDEGVGVRNIGGHYYTHPVNLAVFAMTRLDQFTINGDEEYLELVRRCAERLIARATDRDGAMYFPYKFPWNSHNQIASPMPVPWYSGMAQGYALALFSRLYEVLGEERYLDVAHRVFASYFQTIDGTAPFFVDFVDDHYLWFEEYADPREKAGSATNGHLYAAFCLHDYWLVTGDQNAVALADGAFTTTLTYMDRWRRPGGQSFYGINSPKSTALYHHWHSRQLGQIYNLTADPLWARLQELFMDDYPTLSTSIPENTRLIVQPGTYRVGERGDLTVTTHVDVEIPEMREMTINLRGQRYGELTPSTRVLEPDFEYMWFTEIPDEVYVAGIIEHATWAHTLTYRVIAETPLLYSFNDDASEVSTTDAAIAVGDTVDVEARASIRGRVYARLVNGIDGHHWVPAETLRMVYE